MRRGLSLVIAALVFGPTVRPAEAQFAIAPNAAQIQEDWALVVAQGDTANNGPQVMTYMSPVNDQSSPYAWFLLNVRDTPNPFAPGGMMVQVWDYSKQLQASGTSTATAQLSNANETITWTQRMVVNTATSQVNYDILNLNSVTWGNIAGSQMAVSFTGPASLALYDPNVSVQKSRVGWMPNNVTSLTLKTVRQYDATGALIRTDSVNLAVNLTPN